MEENNEINIHFKFGNIFQNHINKHFQDSGSSKNVNNLENHVYSSNITNFKNHFNGKLTHYDMFRFILTKLEIDNQKKAIEEINENDFVPIVTFQSNQEEKGFKILNNNTLPTIKLSHFIEEDKRNVQPANIILEEDAILFFNVNKGNMNANDNEGNITIKAHGVELDSKHRNVKKIDNNDSKYNYSIDINDIQYGWTFKVKLLEKTLEKGAYLDFYANDDDLFFKSVSNIHCGRIFINQSDKCTCTVFRPAKNFKELISLVKQSEEILVSNGYENINDRISILRGIYYGTEWSLDYINEKSDARNFAFDLYTFSKVTADARKALICSSTCRGNLFESLINSFEIFDSKYKAIDFGHLIIGLDSRRSWSAINTPLNGGTGLENNTWVGDLGGGVAKLSLDRVDYPNKRADRKSVV